MISRKITKAVIALFLALVSALHTPASIVAQSLDTTQSESPAQTDNNEENMNQEETEPEKQYVKEMRISWDKDDAGKAKSWLTDNGYQLVDQDLNAGTGEGYSYLGYKTTSNEEEAITDVSMMDMSGGFEMLDYRSLIEKQTPNIKQMAAEMMAACQEFRENLKAGSPEAKLAKSVLDIFVVEEENNRPLGDYLIDTKRKLGDYYDIILMTNSLVSTYIYNQLTMGTADYGKDNWMKRMSDMGPVEEDDEEKDTWTNEERQILDKAKNLTIPVRIFAQKYLAAKERLDKNGGEIAATVKTEEEVDAEAKRLAEGGEIAEENEDVLYLAVYETLEQYTYGNTNLADYLVDVGKNENIDSKKLCGLAQCLTDGQYAMMRVTGVNSAVMAADNTEESCELGWEQLPNVKQQLLDALDGKSPTLWVGTNIEVYNQEVGLTKEASRAAAASGNYDALTKDNSIKNDLRIAMMYAGIVALSSVAVVIFASVGVAILFGFQISVFMAATALYAGIGTTVGSTIAGVAGLGGPVAVAIVAIVIIAVAAIWYGVLELIELWDYYHPEYTSIPDTMYEYESQNYYGYHVVCDQNGEPADLNNKEGKEWNALYVTTDKLAGSPLVADENGNIFTVKKGGDQNVPKGYEPLTKFGEWVPANTNDHAYDDDENGIFLFHHTVQSLLNADLNQGEIVADNDSKYLESIVIATEKTEEAAKLSLKIDGYRVIDYNLTKGQDDTAAYIGYKVTKNEKQAIRDIRVAYGTEADKYYWGSASYAKAGTVNGITLYYTAFKETGDPVLADIVVTDSLSKKPKGYEPVNLFCGGNAYDMNTYDFESRSDWSTHSYIFFHPSVEYTSGTEYISGYNFVGGIDNPNDVSFFTASPEQYIEELGLIDTGKDMIENCIWFNTYCNSYKRKMKLCYTTTYNPHRAIYDVKVHEAELSATMLAGNISFDGMGYSACEVYTQHSYKYWTKLYRTMRTSHAYSSSNIDDKEYYREELVFVNKYTSGVNVESVIPCRGLYVRGPAAVSGTGKTSADNNASKPLTPEDVIITNSKTCPSGYVSVKKFSDVYNTWSYNLGMGRLRWETWVPWISNIEKEGSYVYMYLKGKEKTKPKYIKSIQLVYDETEDMSKEMCMYNLYSGGGDEIIDYNLATYTGAAELDDYKKEDRTHNQIKYVARKGNLELDEDYKDKSAYIRVTRTDKKSEAIQGIMLYKTSKDAPVPPKTYTKDDIVYTRCGEYSTVTSTEDGKQVKNQEFKGKIKGVNGDFYLYTSYIGRPITDIYFDKQPIRNGRTTSLDQNGKADLKDPWWLQTDSSTNFKYIEKIGVTANDESKKSAMCDLLSQ